nr:TadE family protein [Lapillicoccus jejuensis]
MAEFAMVSVLVVVIGMGVLQLALVLHVRNTLVSCASEGALLGARLGAQPGEGAARTRDLAQRSLAAAYSQDVTQTTVTTPDGVQVVEVTVVAPLPVLGLLGPSGSLTVHGRAFLESQR